MPATKNNNNSSAFYEYIIYRNVQIKTTSVKFSPAVS